MTDRIAVLEAEMAAAAAEQDYARAAVLRDRIAALRGGVAEDAVDLGLTRQRPGAMGIGTSRQRVEPPAGWKPPKKPDPMTRGRGR